MISQTPYFYSLIEIYSFQDKMHTGTDGQRHVKNEIAIEGEKLIFQRVENG